jgi:hypothetical protein
MSKRHYLLPMLDGWTTVFDVPGSRTTGEGAQKFVVTGPARSGTLPAGGERQREGYRWKPQRF